MLKIVYPICCGMDIHKTFIIATIAATNERNVTTYQTKRFSTFTKDLRTLAEWLKVIGCVDVCMESTGKYWIPIYNILESSCRITLAHPKYVKAIRGKKTDKKDSIWIADLHKHGLVPGSFIPPEEIRQIRDLIRYYFKLVSFASSEKNRVQNSLTVSNIMPASVVSDTFGKSASAILDHLLDHPGDRDFDFRRLLHRSMLGKADDIALAIDGMITPPQAKKISLCKSHFDQLKNLMEQVKQIAAELATPFSSHLQIIASVPGISDFSALAIISEIGVDMSQFHSDKHLCSWAGLAPCNDQSAGKKKSVRISRAGVYLKPLLVQCALASLRDKKFPHYRKRYEQIKRRRGHKRAIIAIARMMLTSIFHCLKNGEFFDPSRYDDLPQHPPDKAREFAVRKLFGDAARLGYSLVPSNA